MIDDTSLINNQTIINYDTTPLTIEKYELKFALDFGNPDLQEIIKHCEKNNWPYKIINSDGRQKHIWIKGWAKT